MLTAGMVLGQIKFNSDFESGNIDQVSTADSVNFSVTTIPDIGGRWFYFRISGVKNKNISVRITTSDVNRPMYSYDNRNYQRFTAQESPQINYFKKTFAEDTVWVAYYTPFNFSYLQERLFGWEGNGLAVLDTIGFTDRNFPIQELTVTAPGKNQTGKKHVWIHARTHPGETPSSYHFDGIVETLLMNDPVIEYLRENIVFHLVPFTNPEGVYFGRSRTNFDGVDIESNWDKPESETSTEVKLLKQRMAQICVQDTFAVFLNLHSQASSFCTFWIHTAASTSDYFYRRQYQFANLNTSDNPYFTQNDYSESSLKARYPEGWLWSNYGDKVLALTYETPYDQYSNDTWVTNGNLKELGSRTVYSIAEFLGLSHPKYLLLDNADAQIAGNWTPMNDGLKFYGDDYLSSAAGTGGNYVSYSSGGLSPGNYDIYGWWSDNQSNSFNTKFDFITADTTVSMEKTQKLNGGQWNYMTTAELQNPGTILIKVNQSASGKAVADAFRIIYRGPVTSVKEELHPSGFILYQNFPNPFNPSTRIQFLLNNGGSVKLQIYNLLGELLATLIDGELNAGLHNFDLNMNELGNISSGIYFYRLTTPGGSVTKKMNFVK